MSEQLKILLAEDNPTDAELCEREVRKAVASYQFHRVETRQDFLAALKEYKPDLILSDYKMPSFDGMTALKLAQQCAPHTPFIIVTGSINEDVAVECIKAGAWDYVIKDHIKRLGPAILGALEEKQLRMAKVMAEEQREAAYRAVDKALNDTIRTISKIIEVRDPYTAGHESRVADLSTALAIELKLSDVQVRYLGIAGLIHDIGKIYIPSDILSKPGKLSEMEWQLLKTHAQGSYDILKTIEFPWPIAQIVWQHHERLDGSGYPLGLVDGQISLEARILAVADVVEAMSSHRPYRPALGTDKALEEISRNKGVLYDAVVVDTCLILFEEKRFSF
jgi:response regulator RpfG family c-di-GMP phosphodiesterase